MELTLTSEQAKILDEVLQSNLHQLLLEIAHTDSRSGHTELMRRHEVICGMREQLIRAQATEEVSL
ncbi:MAG: hypothetical protein GXX83_10565 [Gaiellales bacterium]|nr:hypothetical protein [Gaiellales bacterium]